MKEAYGASSGSLSTQNVLEDMMAPYKAEHEIDAPDGRGRTPLMLAAREGKLGKMLYLIRCGANVDAICSADRTALGHATLCSQGLAAKLLLDHGADPDLRMPLADTLWADDARTAKVLVEGNANIDVTDAQGWSLTHVAAEMGAADTLKLLLLAGADPNRPSLDGTTPLMSSLSAGSPGNPDTLDGMLAIMEALVSAGADPDAVDKRGRTALYRAAEHGQVSASHFLVTRFGANPSLRRGNGWTASSAAKRNGFNVLARHLDRLAENFFSRRNHQPRQIRPESPYAGRENLSGPH